MNDADAHKYKLISHTSFGNNHAYSHLWYVDGKNKICITFSPRGGCSVAFQQYLDLVNLLDEGLQYHRFIHKYRTQILNKKIKYIPIGDLQKENYTFIKFIMNPYIRAVTIYRHQKSHNLSFRDFLKQLVKNECDYFNIHDHNHMQSQYIDGEENVITKYIRTDESEKYTIKLADGTDYELDLTKYNSPHHGKKTENTNFCGDIPLSEVNKQLPKSYKYFYDDEIKNMVYTCYKNDIEKYGFGFIET